MQFGVSEAIAHWGRYRRSAVAVRHNGKVASFGELDTSVSWVAEHVLDAPHERVALAVATKLELLIAIASVLRAGKSAVVLNTGLPREALRTNLDDTNVACLVNDARYESMREISDRIEYTVNLNSVLARRRSLQNPRATPAREPRDEWGVLFSSGTTGPPKGIVRDHNSVVTELLGWCLELGLNRGTRFYVGRPIYYTGGLVLALSTLLVGGEIVINDLENDNDPSEVWADYQECCESSGLTWAFFIPDQLRAFVSFVRDTNQIPLGASTILTMGGPISGDEKAEVKRLLHSAVVESWGNTESLGTITEVEDIDTRPNSIGRPFLTDEMYVVDEECNLLGPHEYGKLAGSEEAGFAGYCNRPEATDHAKRNNLIVSEDIGYTDEEGYFYVRGRQEDCILINGETVFVSDIENKLRTHEAIQECCVVPTGDLEGSKELAAAVVARTGFDLREPELLCEINSDLKENHRLDRLVLVPFLPRLPSGKVDKIRVRETLKGTG